jgi:hypothetical protein
MQRLRHARFLARLVLVWFALAVGAAIAAPAVGASSLELVCSGSAIKLVVKGDDGSTRPIGHTLDCPLCVPMDAPPAAASTRSFAPPTSSSPVEAILSSRIAAQTAVPPPARAPPAQA